MTEDFRDRRAVTIEEVALVFERFGLSRTAGRILAYLAITGPQPQSLDTMTAALGGSKASMSTTARALVDRRFIDRAAVAGSRRDHYRLRPDAWAQLHRERASLFDELARAAGGIDDLRQFGEKSAVRLARLVDDLVAGTPNGKETAG